MSRRWRIAGINFDHFHMGDLLRMVHEHPSAQVVGIADEQPERMEAALSDLGLDRATAYDDYRKCIEQTKPDLVVLCPATAKHAEWTERVAEFDIHILMEKPFAASLAESDRMIAAMGKTSNKQLAINWPLRWYPSHVTCHRMIMEGRIGDVQEVHYYNGNRGPLWHGANKIQLEPTSEEKDRSWFYQKDQGGGSLLDYLGYGTTLGTWFLGNRKPIEVTCMVDEPAGLDVDEHSITIARYAGGLSKFETRWGTFTDPWTNQPQPKCGFVVKGTTGTISSYDYDSTIRVQSHECPAGEDLPVDQPEVNRTNPIEYFLDCIENEKPIEGPLSVEICRIGQQIVDTAYRSAMEKQTLALLDS